MKIEPYLFFNGRCDEAIAFYREALNAEATFLMRYHEGPEAPPMPLPAGWEQKVMHANLTIGETQVMVSDGCAAEPMRYAGVSLVLTLPDPAAAARAFDALAQGGQVNMPLAATFFSPCFGMVTDRFGVDWMLVVPGEDEGTERVGSRGQYTD